MNTQVTEYINNAPKEQQEIMNTVRSLLHQSVKNITEEFKWSRPIFKTKKDFAYLQTNKNYVNLGFYKDFEKLNDPKGLIEGTGKTMRDIKIKSVNDIDKNLLKEWFLIIAKD